MVWFLQNGEKQGDYERSKPNLIPGNFNCPPHNPPGNRGRCSFLPPLRSTELTTESKGRLEEIPLNKACYIVESS